MKIAIRSNEVFIDYAERFSDDEIISAPYNYQIVILPDDIDKDKITYSDFDIVDGKYNFNVTNFNTRITVEKETVKNLEYKTTIDGLIRQRYSVSDEIAILRQRDIKPEEYAEYNAYCEQCKAQAKSKLAKKE